jgi:hypothetical protein
MKMADFRPQLLEATNASARMDALCKFVEHWLGPRRSAYGEPSSALAGRSLPMPLQRLYEFAGRWPNWNYRHLIEWNVPALSHQDSLVNVENLSYASDQKVIFLVENQGGWDCRTLAAGDDPPVWCNKEMDLQSTKDNAICDSLSRFLTTFVLQELTLGSRLCKYEEGSPTHLEVEKNSLVPLWNGPYVYGNKDYYLWGDVLVAKLSGKPFFAANRQEGVEFLTKNQGPINTIRLMIGQMWTLDIRPDGSVLVRYLSGQTDETAEAPPGSFDFLDLLIRFSADKVDDVNSTGYAIVFFERNGQSGKAPGKQMYDAALARILLEFSLKKALKPNKTLERLFANDGSL